MRHRCIRSSGIQSLLEKLDGDWWRIGILWLLAMLIRYGLATCAVVCFVNTMSAQVGTFGHDRFLDGEVLTYKVKWSFFRLGTVVIRQTQIDSADPTRFLVSMDVQSAQGLPFIDLHFINQSVVSLVNPGMSVERIITGKDGQDRTTYAFDSRTGTIMMSDSSNGRLVRAESVFADCPCYDALSLFMYARRYAAHDTSVILPTVNDFDVKSTEIRFTGEVEEVDVDALPDFSRARKFDGNALWVGKSFAGMKGPFRGWVSDDEAAVPLRAEIEIFLGSIVMELESYRRKGWKTCSDSRQAATH